MSAGELTEANCYARCNCLKQWLNDVILIRLVIKSHHISYTEKLTERLDCCNKERQHRSKTLSSLCAMVTDYVLKLGYTSVILHDLGAKVNGTYYCDLLLSQQLLPAMHHVSSELIFYKTVPQQIEHAMFSDINISQGSVATPLRCGRICNDLCIANFLLSVTVKEF